MADRAAWAPLNLGHICTKVGSGATPRGGKKVYLTSGPYALIRSQNVLNDGFRTDGIAYIGSEHASTLQNVEVAEGDVLLNITGDSVARACQVHPDVLPARVNQHVAIIRPDPEKLDPLFLRYFLVSPRMQSELLSLAGSGGTRNALTKAMIQSLVVAAPREVDQQRVIADILGALDDKIELNRRMNETLEAIARALFKSWFVDFEPVRAKVEGRGSGLPPHITALFPDRMIDTEHGPTPAGWSREPLQSIIALNPESWTPKNPPASVTYIDLKNTKWGRIERCNYYSWDDAPSRARRVLRPFDTVVGTVRPGNGSYALIDEDGLTGSTGFAVLRPLAKFDREIVWCASTSRDNIERLAHLADGAAYPAVRAETIAATPTVLATDDIRHAFSNLVGPLLERAAQTRRESKTLARIRDALLPKLVSGELRVGDTQ